MSLAEYDERIAGLKQSKDQMIANANMYEGALQEASFWRNRFMEEQSAKVDKRIEEQNEQRNS